MDRDEDSGAECEVATLEDLARQQVHANDRDATEDRRDGVARQFPVGNQPVNELR